MTLEKEQKQVNIYNSFDGTDHETIKSVQEEVFNKCKDAQGVVHLSIENLHVHSMVEPEHHRSSPYGFPDLGFFRHPHRNPRKNGHGSFNFDFTYPYYGHFHFHRKGKHVDRHFKGRHYHRRYHYWQLSPPRTESEDNKGEEPEGETNRVEMSHFPPFWRSWGRRHKRGRYGHSRFRSRCCKKCDKEKNSESDEFTNNIQESCEREMEEDF